MSAARFKSRIEMWLFAAAVLGLLLADSRPCRAQTSGQGSTGTGRSIRTIQTDPADAFDLPTSDPLFRERRMRQLAIANYKSMVSDTDKLVELVNELNNEVGTTNPGSFTPDQLHKIAQIEKLAHSVKDKMRNSLQSVQDNMEAIPNRPGFRE